MKYFSISALDVLQDKQEIEPSASDAVFFHSADDASQENANMSVQKLYRMPGIKIIAQTDVGGPMSKYAHENQDGFIVGRTKKGVLRAGVIDGAGGSRDGGLASALLISSIQKNITDDMQAFSDIVEKANAYLYKKNASFAEDEKKMYATGVFLELLPNGKAEMFWVGDAKGLVLHEKKVIEAGNTSEQNVARTHVEMGLCQPEEYYVHPHLHIITNTLGVNAHVQDTYGRLPVYETKKGDYILLYSDGIGDVLSPEDIEHYAKTCSTVRQLEEKIFARSYARNNSGIDGFTIRAHNHEGKIVRVQKQINEFADTDSQEQILAGRKGGDNMTLLVVKIM